MCMCVSTNVCAFTPVVSHILFIYLSVEGHLCCFHILAVVSHAVVNRGVQLSLCRTPTVQILEEHI